MRINEETAVVGPRVGLVPYRKEYVPQYHEWMSDQELRESTASEPLTLQEEYEMCERWAQDQDKLTFIIFARKTCLPTTNIPKQPEKHDSDCDFLGDMIGDVNLFLSSDESSDSTSSCCVDTHKGELEIMIASTKHRHLGLATEALQLFLSYIHLNSSQRANSASTHFPVLLSFLFVKISFNNTTSQRLFEKLGFEKYSTSEVFGEHEYRLNFPDPTLSIAEMTDPKAEATLNEIIPACRDHKSMHLYDSRWKDTHPIKIAIVPFPR
ncbi:hypothetical protein PCASD_08231 [Puccinia coronata f. sp. avenae]|uniref:N-acetyltransferase domain-containing protein n=1 Tax=Puccinia coronata f. sp. avenae TaxID=200324 RepID=A0A2N5ULJ4_9BASI|nr:hypothetical protein PCASD_08231 [Puccinia coronata f. sp. avenae]